MQFVGLILILVGLYLVDSGIRNRAPIGFLKAIIEDPSNLSETLDEYNGKWTGPFGPTTITPEQRADNIAANQAAGASSEIITALKAQGYSNGRLPASVLTIAPGQSVTVHKVYSGIAEQFGQMNAAYKAEFGTPIQITDGYRSYAGQVAAKAAKGFLAATPGNSNHGWGLALDLGGGIQSFGSAQHKWMDANAPRFGFAQPDWARQGGRKPEPWHYEYVGGGSGRDERSRGGTF